MIAKQESFNLLDGTTIPWLAWGNGTGASKKNAVECGQLALTSGIRHLDTAQIYGTEIQTGEVVRESEVPREEIYVTSKISNKDNQEPVSLSEVTASVQGSLDRLGFAPDLFLVHNPYVPKPGELKAFWSILEGMKDKGQLKSIGVSNFRPQDLEEILDGAKYKPVVNQLEYHPYTLAHLEPLLELQEKHGILTASYGPLTPTIRHPTGGPLKPVLHRIAARVSKALGKTIDANVVLLLWTRAQKVIAVTTSANEDRIKTLGEIATLPNLLTPEEVEEITNVGKTIHFRFYSIWRKTFPCPTCQGSDYTPKPDAR